jgi:hypothetical protein
MSVFSGLNNLQDLSLDDEYSGICGITQEELDKCCQAGILQVSEMNGIGEEEAREQLRKRYDGYHFSEGSVDVYNPYSLMQVFKTGKMKSYWFTSGTSQLLWRQVSKLSDEESLTGVLYPILSEQELEASEDDGMTLPSLLYQTGYLTIKGLTPTKRAYQLGIPNEEVKEGIMGGLLPLISRRTPRKTGSDLERLRDYADRGEVGKLMNHIQSFLSEISYEVTGKRPEVYYENNLYILFNLIGINTKTEVSTSEGRMDIQMENEEYVYIIELKLDRNSKEALNQIKERRYYLPYMRCGKRIILIGVNFSSERRNIQDWVSEELQIE